MKLIFSKKLYEMYLKTKTKIILSLILLTLASQTHAQVLFHQTTDQFKVYYQPKWESYYDRTTACTFVVSVKDDNIEFKLHPVEITKDIILLMPKNLLPLKNNSKIILNRFQGDIALTYMDGKLLFRIADIGLLTNHYRSQPQLEVLTNPELTEIRSAKGTLYWMKKNYLDRIDIHYNMTLDCHFN